MPMLSGPQAHHRHEQHEEVQPALVGERNPKICFQKTVGPSPSSSLLFLRRRQTPWKVSTVSESQNSVWLQPAPWMAHSSAPPRILHALMWNGQGPVVEALCRKQQETKIAATPKASREEPAALTQG